MVWPDAPRVLALASSRKSPKRSSKTGGNSRGRSGGFASVNPATNSIDDANDEIAKRTVRSLFSVCSHIQDPELYQPHWADACHYATDNEGKSAVVTSNDVQKGHVLTLFPIHALGLRTLRRNADAKKKKKHRRDDTEFIAYDLDRDGEYFKEDNQQAGLRMKLNIPLDDSQPASPSILNGDRKSKILYSMLFRDDIVPGWLGGRVRTAAKEANCVTIPLPGAAPICAVVATRDLNEGEELVQGVKSPEMKVLEDCKNILTNDYEAELAELKTYIEMACTAASSDAKSNTATDAKVGVVELGPFHQIQQQYPGLNQLHKNPDIFAVENFLSDDECDRIIAKATPHLTPCIIKNESSGAIEQDLSRTSTDANLPQAEAPSIISKLSEFLLCDANQLEILQILRYTQGQEFKPHTDGYTGPISASGFDASNRLVTIFCYLNDVTRGGSTYFNEIDLEIRPKKGMAIVHFPSDIELREDARTTHQGMPAIDEKYLLATWYDTIG
ncbi:hypothetical protein ACHAXR_009483 [Thalassiosira sp. AJA248-18]